jgi:hypothetical protein
MHLKGDEARVVGKGCKSLSITTANRSVENCKPLKMAEARDSAVSASISFKRE